MKSPLPFVALLFALPSLAFATAQYPEKIIINGKEEAMMATPLEDFWTRERPKPKSLDGTSSALWRGYIATWTIENDYLILLKIERPHWVNVTGEYGADEEVRLDLPLSYILKVKSDEPLVADWFSGVLRIAWGEQLKYVHMGFGSVYEEDLFLFVDHGKIIRRLVVRNDPESLTAAPDLSWRELGNMTAGGGVKVQAPDVAATAEQGDWITYREISDDYETLLARKEPVRLRGIYFSNRLWFPPQDRHDATLPLQTDRVKNLPRVGAAVEVTGKLIDTTQGLQIVATAITELPAGAAIQRRRKE